MEILENEKWPEERVPFVIRAINPKVVISDILEGTFVVVDLVPQETESDSLPEAYQLHKSRCIGAETWETGDVIVREGDLVRRVNPKNFLDQAIDSFLADLKRRQGPLPMRLRRRVYVRCHH